MQPFTPWGQPAPRLGRSQFDDALRGAPYPLRRYPPAGPSTSAFASFDPIYLNRPRHQRQLPSPTPTCCVMRRG
jgi:hypothetical protein